MDHFLFFENRSRVCPKSGERTGNETSEKSGEMGKALSFIRFQERFLFFFFLFFFSFHVCGLSFPQQRLLCKFAINKSKNFIFQGTFFFPFVFFFFFPWEKFRGAIGQAYAMLCARVPGLWRRDVSLIRRSVLRRLSHPNGSSAGHKRERKPSAVGSRAEAPACPRTLASRTSHCQCGSIGCGRVIGLPGLRAM